MLFFLNIWNQLSYWYVKFSCNSNHFCHFWACFYYPIYFLVMGHTKRFSTCSQILNLGLTLGIPHSWGHWLCCLLLKRVEISSHRQFIDWKPIWCWDTCFSAVQGVVCSWLDSSNILIVLLNYGCSGVSAELAMCSVRTLWSSWEELQYPRVLCDLSLLYWASCALAVAVSQ